MLCLYDVVIRYWYKNGALRPDLMTVFIAMDPCTKVNGGLQVIVILDHLTHPVYQDRVVQSRINRYISTEYAVVMNYGYLVSLCMSV